MYKILANTLFIGKKVIYLPTCHSTNKVAEKLLSESDIPEGTLIITQNQTHGKGQLDNSWESEPGKNLTLSIILFPDFLKIQHQFYLNIIISLGIYDVLNNLLSQTDSKHIMKIKWPNDIIADEKKICGILIKNFIKNNEIDSCIAGIGLNVNQRSFISKKATSVNLLTGTEYDLNTVLNELILSLEAYYLKLKEKQFDYLKKAYLKNLFWINEEHKFSDGEPFKGKITGIDDHGRLMINTDYGVRFFNFKEVEFVS